MLNSKIADICISTWTNIYSISAGSVNILFLFCGLNAKSFGIFPSCIQICFSQFYHFKNYVISTLGEVESGQILLIFFL